MANVNEDSVDTEVQRPLFFNYHEFSETYYADIDGRDITFRGHDEAHEICITHFPNIYVPVNSEKFYNTRIVRIPRTFQSSLDYPQFSTVLPGSEPAAVDCSADGLKFVPHAYYDSPYQLFGYSSVSPLSNHLSCDEFDEIITHINDMIGDSFKIGSAFNIVDLTLEVLTLTLWKWVSKYVYPNPLLKVDEYIKELNNSSLFLQKNIRIIPLRESGYLSLDFEIPIPQLHQ